MDFPPIGDRMFEYSIYIFTLLVFHFLFIFYITSILKFTLQNLENISIRIGIFSIETAGAFSHTPTKTNHLVSFFFAFSTLRTSFFSKCGWHFLSFFYFLLFVEFLTCFLLFFLAGLTFHNAFCLHALYVGLAPKKLISTLSGKNIFEVENKLEMVKNWKGENEEGNWKNKKLEKGLGHQNFQKKNWTVKSNEEFSSKNNSKEYKSME